MNDEASDIGLKNSSGFLGLEILDELLLLLSSDCEFRRLPLLRI